MEANPRFKTGASRGNDSPPSSQRNRGSTGRLGLEAVRGDTLSSLSLLRPKAWMSGCMLSASASV